jgi:uncharacterized protein
MLSVTDDDVPSSWLPYVRVADVDATIEKAVQLGAEVLMPPTDILGAGRMSMIRDPQGAALYVMKPMPR